MKKLLKILAYAASGLALIILAVLLYVFTASNSRIKQTFDVQPAPIAALKTPADLAEGKRLYVSRGCGDCHGDNAGGKTFIDDGAIGRFSGANLTSGKGGIAGERSDADLALAIRHGVGQKGRALVFMPSTDFKSMTDEDAARLIAYLRTVPAVDNQPPVISVGPVARILFLTGKLPLLVAAEQIDHKAAPAPRIEKAVSVEYGKYVASTCTGCHRDNLQGGPIQGAPPEWLPAQNIAGKALAHYNEAQFIAALRTGKRPDGSEIRFPMPWQSLAKLTDIEMKALYKYLVSL